MRMSAILSLIIMLFSFAAYAADPEMPELLKGLEKQGVAFRYLGGDQGLNGWVGFKDGQEQYFYVTPDNQAIISGQLLNNKGDQVTLRQIQNLRKKDPGVDTLAQPPSEQPPAATPAATAPPKEPVPAPAAGPDLVQQWTIETEKLRTQIRELIDQEAVAQLDINVIMNRVNAPVTSVGERDRALKDLEVAQNKLTATRDQLLRKRSELQARELQGPPRK